MPHLFDRLRVALIERVFQGVEIRVVVIDHQGGGDSGILEGGVVIPDGVIGGETEAREIEFLDRVLDFRGPAGGPSDALFMTLAKRAKPK